MILNIIYFYKFKNPLISNGRSLGVTSSAIIIDTIIIIMLTYTGGFSVRKLSSVG